MRIERVDPGQPEPASIRAAAERIRSGGLVAFPTETVYGLGANAMDPDAVQRIFEAKGRPSYNPLIVHCADVDAARELAREWPEIADRLAAAFWPGPLTLVLPKRAEVPDAVTAGLSTVALRVPAHPVAAALLREAGVPIAAPSANRSTELSPTAAAHVVKGLGAAVDIVLDAGPSAVGIESTVLDVSGVEPVLLRPGTIPAERIGQVLGRPLKLASAPAGTAARPSPGMMDRHYAPRARLRLVDPDDGAIDRFAREARGGGAVVGALLLSAEDRGSIDHPIRMPTDADAYARRLYGALHDLDDLGCEVVLVERVPMESRWAGVRDRLTRAATPA